MTEPQTTPAPSSPSTGPDAEATTPPVDVEALIAKAKAAKAEDEERRKLYASTAVARDLSEAASPDAILSLCERLQRAEAEAERLRASSVSPAVDDVALQSTKENVMTDPIRETLEDMLKAVCGPNGFAAAVRSATQTKYPWPALDLAEEKARAALAKEQS